MGLPQELIDHIMDMLRDDVQALKACSLTCRTMFVSTRRLIYHTLRLPPQKYRRDPTWLRAVSLMGERGLLQYARQVHIDWPPISSPEILLPHLHHFQSLDQVHTLTIEYCHVTPEWSSQHKTCFVHFYPTMTSLTLHRPSGQYRVILQFALQFPNLEDLCIESVDHELLYNPGIAAPAIVNRSPPLRGHLRLEGAAPSAQYSKDLAYELPNGINFRSVELEDLAGSDAQHILNGCAHSLENLIITPLSTSTHWLSLLSWVMTGFSANFPPTGGEEFVGLTFAEINVLRRLTFRMWLSYMSTFEPQLLLRALSTVTSPVFCELVLELGGHPYLDEPSSVYQDRWQEIDRHLEERFRDRRDFKIIIRKGDSYGWEYFQRHVKEYFPLLARRGCIEFEKFHD
jgi:hypothetical protein